MVDNTAKWGRAKARERYGSPKEYGADSAASAKINFQSPQDPVDKQGAGYDNDQRNDWVKGGPNESAEGKSNFDKGPVHGGKRGGAP